MRRRTIFFAVLASVALVGPGCSLLNEGYSVPRRPVAAVVPMAVKKELAKLPNGWKRRTMIYSNGRDVTWLVAPLAKDEWSWSMENDPHQPKTAAAWRQALNANLAINGAYFDVDYSPAGFYQTPQASSTHAWPDQKQQIDPKSYSGMVSVSDGRLQLTHLVTHPQNKPSAHDSVLLTYPTLILDGKALVKEDTQKFARRTILAQDATDTVYVIMIEQGAVSLYEASEWLAAQPEKFRIAVNLDGGPSTGMSYAKDGQSLEIGSVPIPNILTATALVK